MDAVIDLLLTAGYLDGLLHEREQSFIRQYLDRLAEHHPRAQVDAAYARLEAELAALAAEVVAAGDARYTRSRLKLRAVTLFHGLSPADRAVALELLDAMMRTDGTVSPEERELQDELRAYFDAAAGAPTPAAAPPEMLRVEAPQALALSAFSHPWLDPIEQAYAADPARLHAQLASDYNLVFQAITAWERQRARGNGRLLGVTDIAQLAPGTRLLDRHVHVMRPDRPTELVVLGDLHGCYACFKAALLQSQFIDRAAAHQRDPANHPDVKLVLLGDYLDRGRFGFEGVLRAALQLLVTLPDHVIVLRGNHEFLVRMGDQIVSSVNPAESVPALTERAPLDLLEAYRHLFEHMPTSLVFERTLFVHGGIPREDTFAERVRDLSSLDDSVVRFEMMWGDPSAVDRVPVELQRESPRFPFGREQFRAFMERVGCHTLIRGHEQVDAGFATPFDLGTHRLHTLFSAGGHDNTDLPPDSRYRSVTPMALTIRDNVAIPWAIQYQPFDDASHNGLYRLS